uniref:Cyclic nucleotide-binding domain-containing protein n=1 Tax=Arcella intermedia TaxID=1963864 RepID=A0A6B2L2C3_9EUKA|eukprot:TRINITY_DN3444_c1_g1_i1.p1 TRINITY_DN3444_c1_g1~~TRINITY_DN3444_c1_g1_i1.p1  ORF type:complete len:509 (+),score=117.64 TRINITY_DN3444_c1_g1_i1:529-2055(+)
MKRRYSVSSESFTPEQFRDVKLKIIPKPEEVKQRIRVTVRSNVLFKHLDDAELNEVVDAMEEIEFPERTVVIKQGALIDENNMYLVNKGELEVLYGEEVVATLTTGAAFGEIALMYGCPRTATVRTRVQCSLWVLDRNTFRRILMEESMRRRKLYESVLSKVPIFKGLLPYERSKIADALEAVHFKDKDVIITQGSTDTDKFYIIEKGEVVCTKKSTDGKSEVEALRLKAGDYFGELALLKNEPRQATVTASGPVKCLTIGREHFNQVMGPCEDLLRRNMGTYKSYEELVSSLTSAKSSSPHFELFGDLSIPDLPESYGDILKYIIRNDSDYLFNLNQTEGFYNAMTEHAESLDVLPEQINIIFSNFKEILAFQKKFNAFLLDLCEGYNVDLSDLAELYSSQAPSFSVYEPFVTSYKESVNTRKECARNTLFSDFLMECHKWAGESIDTYLEAIYTRVPKIAIMLSQLLEATAPSHPDKNLLAIAVRKIDNEVKNMRKLDDENELPKT